MLPIFNKGIIFKRLDTTDRIICSLAEAAISANANRKDKLPSDVSDFEDTQAKAIAKVVN